MRKTLASLLIFCVLYQCAGYLFVFEANFLLCRKEMKRAIKAGLDEQELQHFSFTEEEYEQLDWQHKNEFQLNGVLYDVVRTEKHNGTLELACVNDKQESVLFAHLNEHIDSFSDLQNDGKSSTKVLLKLLKIQALPIVYSSTPSLTFKAIDYISLPLQRSSTWGKSEFQPPELA